MKREDKEDVNLKLLIKTSDRTMLSLIESTLKENNIPYITKDKGTGGYLKIIAGASIYDTEIYVSDNDLAKAREVVDLLTQSDTKF
ncbi:DUF2007 domain-containing protein [Soehngenia longivitae]|uniref:DUF2007 domain-containing protein n=1 Tax=Soehngenia longivitae TaxID=2562294 RepID=A0A4Z0D5V4_9FIRM|nr:DUF2007 domain-containing protein [Soehngenia longivitae]TFZ40257.1 DUF2007 domain-containing protein [Soehngenia longivitae]